MDEVILVVSASPSVPVWTVLAAYPEELAEVVVDLANGRLAEVGLKQIGNLRALLGVRYGMVGDLQTPPTFGVFITVGALAWEGSDDGVDLMTALAGQAIEVILTPAEWTPCPEDVLEGILKGEDVSWAHVGAVMPEVARG
jgi:hypothetical protein